MALILIICFYLYVLYIIISFVIKILKLVVIKPYVKENNEIDKSNRSTWSNELGL